MIISEMNAIWFRKYRRLMSDKLEILGELIWPLIVIFVLGFGVDSFFTFDNFSYLEFMSAGIIATVPLFYGISSGASFIEDKKGLLKELLVSPLSRTGIFIGSVISEAIVMLIPLVLVLIILMFYLNIFSIVSFLICVVVLFISAITFYGLGLVLSFGFNKIKHFNQISGTLATLMLFLSGAYFPINGLPEIVKYVVYINPAYYSVETIRLIMIGVGEGSVISNFVVLLIYCVLLTVLGVYAFTRKTQN